MTVQAGVLDRFLAVVQRTPDALAIIDGDVRMTYRVLDELSSAYAVGLQERGVRPGDVIALAIRKGFHAYALIIACVKVGCPYFFLDLRSAPIRNQKILDRAAPVLLIADAGEQSGPGACPVVGLADLNRSGKAPKLPSPDMNRPLYVMFTSGSTGEPKGVVIPHRGVLMLADWARDYQCIGPDDRVSNLNPLHFDNSVFDVYCTLLNGATLVAVDTEFVPNLAVSVTALSKAQVTIIFAVPTYFMMLSKLRLLSAQRLPTVRIVQFGGEGYPIPALVSLRKAFGPTVRLINVYGPTECSCICSGIDVSEEMLAGGEGLPPLGRLNPDFYFRVLDEDGKDAPAGEAGELWLGGPAVALGYLNNPGETARRFLPCPWPEAGGGQMYRTGDLVKLMPASGYLEFIGRADNQVKITGHRIELEEIDRAIESIGGIQRAVTVAKKSGAGDAYLVTGVSATMDHFDELAVIDQIRQRLPPYMVPRRVIVVPEMPLNRSGKVDRRALAAGLDIGGQQ